MTQNVLTRSRRPDTTIQDSTPVCQNEDGDAQSPQTASKHAPGPPPQASDTLTAAPETATPAPAVDCMACTHSAQGHDKTALRFCDATIAHAYTRNCICRP
jgi:hypothetical protein